jgi:hypothetical protein
MSHPFAALNKLEEKQKRNLVTVWGENFLSSSPICQGSIFVGKINQI